MSVENDITQFCDFTVKYDIVYDHDKRDCQFNDERKSVFDLYVPRNTSPVKESTPVVLFVHGGGWRRGDKSAWKYFLSRDINLLAVLVNLLFGLYGNVGKALARRGIACAVMSYPLTQLSTSWLLLELTTSYLSCLFVLCILIVSSNIIFWFVWSMVTYGGFHVFTILLKQDLTILSLTSILITNILILTVISIQRDYHKLTWLRVFAIWLTLLVVTLLIPKQYFLVTLTSTTFLIGQGILLNTNLNVKRISLDDQVVSVAKCMKKTKDIGDETESFDSKAFYLMGHSAGGHLCSVAALCDEYLKDQGMSSVDIKGVITISPVLQLSRMDTMFVRPLYLHPTFGHKPETWMKRCPSQNLLEQSENDSYVPSFLIVTAEKDIKIIKDGAYDFHRESNKLNEGMSNHLIFPGTNHVSIICNFDKTVKKRNLADVCSDFIKRSVSYFFLNYFKGHTGLKLFQQIKIIMEKT